MLAAPAGGAPAQAAAAAAAAQPAALHSLGNVALPPEVAASLLAQAAQATAVGELQGVSPPAQFLGANPSYTRLSLPDLCQRFIDRDWQPEAAPPRLGVVYAFRNQEADGVPLADPAPLNAAVPGWKGSFPGKPAWTRGFLRRGYGFLKAQATFKSKDRRYEVWTEPEAGHAFSCALGWWGAGFNTSAAHSHLVLVQRQQRFASKSV